jgi:hypothetical protein
VGVAAGVATAVAAAFAERGFGQPEVFPVQPADGAKRIA